jgi:hypothetical protein
MLMSGPSYADRTSRFVSGKRRSADQPAMEYGDGGAVVGQYPGANGMGEDQQRPRGKDATEMPTPPTNLEDQRRALRPRRPWPVVPFGYGEARSLLALRIGNDIQA